MSKYGAIHVQWYTNLGVAIPGYTKRAHVRHRLLVHIPNVREYLIGRQKRSFTLQLPPQNTTVFKRGKALLKTADGYEHKGPVFWQITYRRRNSLNFDVIPLIGDLTCKPLPQYLYSSNATLCLEIPWIEYYAVNDEHDLRSNRKSYTLAYNSKGLQTNNTDLHLQCYWGFEGAPWRLAIPALTFLDKGKAKRCDIRVYPKGNMPSSHLWEIDGLIGTAKVVTEAIYSGTEIRWGPTSLWRLIPGIGRKLLAVVRLLGKPFGIG